jgi:hypothetical protein
VVIEVKDVKGSAWPTWCRQAEAEAGGRPWIVVRRERGNTDVGSWPCWMAFGPGAEWLVGEFGPSVMWLSESVAA